MTQINSGSSNAAKPAQKKVMPVRGSAPGGSTDDAAATVLQSLVRRQSQHAYQRSIVPYQYVPPTVQQFRTFEGLRLPNGN